MRRLRELYDYRIVNVNVNILVAGVVALVITAGIMHMAEQTGVLGTLTEWAKSHRPRVLGFQLHGDKMVVSGLTFIVDLIADVLVYYGLHWLANHMPRSRTRPKTGAYADLSFMRDATLVQFERALLSPILYIAALGLQSKLLHEGHGVGFATSVGFAVGLVLSRALHTIWMMRAERKAGVRSAADVVGPDTAPQREDAA